MACRKDRPATPGLLALAHPSWTFTHKVYTRTNLPCFKSDGLWRLLQGYGRKAVIPDGPLAGTVYGTHRHCPCSPGPADWHHPHSRTMWDLQSRPRACSGPSLGQTSSEECLRSSPPSASFSGPGAAPPAAWVPHDLAHCRLRSRIRIRDLS